MDFIITAIYIVGPLLYFYMTCRISEDLQGNINIVAHHVPMLNMVRNGVSLVIVKLVMLVVTVIHALNNSSIPRYTNRQNAMTYSRPATVLGDYFVHLHMWNVSLLFYTVVIIL